MVLGAGVVVSVVVVVGGVTVLSAPVPPGSRGLQKATATMADNTINFNILGQWLNL